MQTIQAIATVNDDGELTLRIPQGIAPGRYRVVLVINEEVVEQHALGEFPVISVGAGPEGFSLRREDMYGDDGR